MVGGIVEVTCVGVHASGHSERGAVAVVGRRRGIVLDVIGVRAALQDVLNTTNGAALLTADSILAVDFIRVVNQAVYVRIPTIEVWTACPPRGQGGQVGITPICGTISSRASVKSIVIGAVGARGPTGSGLELQGALATDFIDQGLHVGIVWNGIAGWAKSPVVLHSVPIVEAAIVLEIGWVIVVSALTSRVQVGPSPVVGHLWNGSAVEIDSSAQIFCKPTLVTDFQYTVRMSI